VALLMLEMFEQVALLTLEVLLRAMFPTPVLRSAVDSGLELAKTKRR
jgi:hypothetical protein